MEIKIFDVEHGFCSLVLTDNRQSILIDAGHNSTTGFRPSQYFPHIGIGRLDHLVITNYDEDHLSDLPYLIGRGYRPRTLHFNDSISKENLRRLKESQGKLGSGMLSLLDLLSYYTIKSFPPIYVDGINITHYMNVFPEFTDTNNLSLVTFLDYRDIRIIFPGDIEKAGWESLLNDKDFRTKLSQVNIFIASHHGRESGYCESLFNYFTPDIIIISDGTIKYDTQRDFYGKHSKGVDFEGNKRFVLTTRCDRMITISQNQYSTASIHTNR